MQGRTFAIVALKTEALYSRVFCGQLLYNIPAAISATVIYHYYFVRIVVLFTYARYPRHQLRQRLFFIKQGYYDRYIQLHQGAKIRVFIYTVIVKALLSQAGNCGSWPFFIDC